MSLSVGVIQELLLVDHVVDGFAVDEGGDQPMMAVSDATPALEDDDRGVGVGLPGAGLDVVQHEPYFQQVDLPLVGVSDPPGRTGRGDSADIHRCLAIGTNLKAITPAVCRSRDGSGVFDFTGTNLKVSHASSGSGTQPMLSA
jgi:hypothetical protein